MPPRKGWAAVYCRLSKEDEEKTARESESIRNQRALLLAWAAEHGYRIYRVYTDAAVIIGLKTIRLKKFQKHGAF